MRAGTRVCAGLFSNLLFRKAAAVFCREKSQVYAWFDFDFDKRVVDYIYYVAV